MLEMEKLNMKEQYKYEIIKKWAEGKIKYKTAKLKLGYSEPHMYRLKKIYKQKGKDGFIHGNRGRKPKTTIDQSLSDNILLYYQTEYQGFNFKHYKYMLEIEKGIKVSYTKIYSELTIKNNILSPKAKKITRKNYKKMMILKKKENKNKSEKEIDKIVSAQIALEDSTPRLPRPANAGENIELDASSYIFFGDKKTHLHLSIDASTDTCTGAYLDNQETLNGYYNVLYQILINYGSPLKFTTDGRTIFEYLSKKMKTDEKAYFTQFKHACNILGIDLEVTSKSQKKPRVEKYNATFQDRLSKELHHLNINTIEEANEYLINTFIPKFNEMFANKITEKNSVFEKLFDDQKSELNYILAVLSTRTFNSGNSISYKNKIYMPYNENDELVCYRKGTKCTIIEAFDKKLYVQVYNEVFILKELQEYLKEDETIEDYFNRNKIKNELPKPQSDWDNENLNDIFEQINKEYNIYDSHNPKI